MQILSSSKRVFITGIAGFIGFHLAQSLKQRGDFVIGCDNFNAYYDPQLKRERVKRLEGVQVVEGDICDGALIENLVEKHEITHFVHLAAQAGVRNTDPSPYMHSNLQGFVQILEVLRRHPHIKLTFASSSSVYGLNEKTPFSESDKTDQPASFYGATKKANELIAHAYHNLYGISAIGLRFFTVYGPWGRPDMAYYSFTKSILEGKTIPIFNQGQVSRDFTYIDDIVKGIVAAMDCEEPWEIFNLGNSHPHGVLELIHCIEKCTGKRAITEMKPMQPGDVLATYADISKSREKLRFSPSTSLEKGIAKFVEWYCDYSNWAKASGMHSMRSEATTP